MNPSKWVECHVFHDLKRHSSVMASKLRGVVGLNFTMMTMMR